MISKVVSELFLFRTTTHPEIWLVRLASVLELLARSHTARFYIVVVSAQVHDII